MYGFYAVQQNGKHHRFLRPERAPQYNCQLLQKGKAQSQFNDPALCFMDLLITERNVSIVVLRSPAHAGLMCRSGQCLQACSNRSFCSAHSHR